MIRGWVIIPNHEKKRPTNEQTKYSTVKRVKEQEASRFHAKDAAIFPHEMHPKQDKTSSHPVIQ